MNFFLLSNKKTIHFYIYMVLYLFKFMVKKKAILILNINYLFITDLYQTSNMTLFLVLRLLRSFSKLGNY